MIRDNRTNRVNIQYTNDEGLDAIYNTHYSK